MNRAFQEYKASFKINYVTLVPTRKGIELQKTKPIEIELEDIPKEIQRGFIEAEPMTYEEKQMLIERRKKQYAKFGKVYERPKATIDREWQREIIKDLEIEFNERNYGGYGR